MLPRADEGDLPSPKLMRHVREGGQRIRVAHVVEIAARRDVHAHPARPPHGDESIDDFEHQARTIFDRAAIFVRAGVGAVLEKLIDEITVGAV